ncbi:hypothetical protein [Lacrimispora sp.]|uniref:hypothetical protein n=1 Tax=Lacrimispora sp. TaxID=2719234 RepID=UPI0028A19FBD|nr:hypothetical protein [Lacrimispora sp.]
MGVTLDKVQLYIKGVIFCFNNRRLGFSPVRACWRGFSKEIMDAAKLTSVSEAASINFIALEKRLIA